MSLSFDNVTFSNQICFGRKRGRLTLSHSGINNKTKVNAWYTNNKIIAEAEVPGGTVSYTYNIPKGASIKRQTVTSKAKDGFMRVYFIKLTDFDLEEACASQEVEDDSN